MKKYYYVLVDKQEKTITLREYEPSSCYSREMEKVKKEYGFCDIPIWQLEGRFKIFHNDTKNYIDYETLYKYARKYRVVA